MPYTWLTFKNAVKALLTDKTISDDTAVRAIADYVRAKSLRDFGGDPTIAAVLWSNYLEQRKDLLGYTVTLDNTTLRSRVRQLLTDASISDETAILAVAEFVKAKITSHVDKNPTLSQEHDRQWMKQRNRLLGYTVTLTHDALRAAVNKLITVDGQRHGIEDFIDSLIDQASSDLTALATYVDTNISQGKIDLAGSAVLLDNTIRQGVIELQNFVESYRVGHETVFQPSDMTDEGEASVGTLPEGCLPQDAYYLKNDTVNTRMPVAQYDWQNRFDLVAGSVRVTGTNFLIAFDPNGSSFTLFPPLMDGYTLSLFWTGLKLTFADGDTVPFDEGFAAAVADYTQSMRYRLPSSLNLKLAEVHQGAYASKRRQLFRNVREKSQLAFRNDSPQPNGAGCLTCAVSE